MPEVTVARIDQLKVPLGAAVVLLLGAAFGSWPYGYYQLLRLVVCGAAAYGAYVFAETSKGRMWTLIGIAVMFNPLAPLRLSREDWQPIDFITAVVLALIVAVRPRRRER